MKFSFGQKVRFISGDHPAFRGTGTVNMIDQRETDGRLVYLIDDRRYDDGWAASEPKWFEESQLSPIPDPSTPGANLQ